MVIPEKVKQAYRKSVRLDYGQGARCACNFLIRWGSRSFMLNKDRIPPEIDLLILSFPVHSTWEFLQAPLFLNMQTATHIDGIARCFQATLGDMGIVLAAFWMAALQAQTRDWVSRKNWTAPGIFFGTGFVATAVIEFISTEVLARWTYDPSMPRLPLIGTGLTPLLQWMLIPMLVLWYLRRLSKQ
jgi:hypothetical protein